MFSIVAHCHLRWDFVWQRPQQIFARLAERHPVLFLEEPVWEPGEPHLRLGEPLPNLVRAVPVFPEPLAADAYCAALLPLLQQALARHPLLAGRFEAPVQWFYSPMTAPHMVGRLGERLVVYDCMDELANFRFALPDIAKRERLLLSRADVVFTGGYQLFEAKSRHHTNVHFHGCGVDVAHFGKARLAGTALPSEVSDLPRPRLGYFGVIDERLDYELISRLAREFPEASVVMVGPLAKVEPEQLPREPNLHWLGQRPYAELPAFVKAFGVCLMPFALNEATRYINPTKTLEYMAAGKPVVSTAVADVVRNFSAAVSIARSHGEFVDAVRRAAAQPDAARIALGHEMAAASTWDAVVGAMRTQVLRALEGRRAAVAA